ncbi:hypothetical protein D9M71_740330 [compost metagenome]
MQDHGYAALGVGNTGPVGAFALGAKRALGDGAGAENGVVMHHQQKMLATATFEGADDVVAHRGCCRAGLNRGAQRLQTLDQQRADFIQALFGAGAGINCNQGL